MKFGSLLRLVLPVLTLGVTCCSGGGGAPASPGSSISSEQQPANVSLSASAKAISPGPNAAYEATQPFYKCATNYYLSPSGSDHNSGASPSSAWQTIGYAGSQVLPPGSCINMSPGVYSQSSAAFVDHGGNSASPLGYEVWRCSTMPFSFANGALQGEGSGCVVRATAPFTGLPNLVEDNTPYVIFDGIEFDGNNNVAGNCLYVWHGAVPQPHHIVILNSDIHGCGYGFGAGVDWTFVIHSVWHDTASNTSNGSGFSTWEPAELESYTPTPADNSWCSTIPVAACYHVVVAYNVAYHNFDSQTAGDTNTDGEGIIFDTWSAKQFSSPGLIMGNVVYDNGGRGITCFSNETNGLLVIANNSTYANGWDTHSNGARAELSSQGCYNVYALNNIAYAVPGSGVLSGNVVISAQNGGSGGGGSVSYYNNLAFGANLSLQSGYSYSTSGSNHNDLGVDPGYVSVSPGSTANNFALQPDSPAIGFGTPFSLWNQAGIVDAGACPRSLSSCP